MNTPPIAVLQIIATGPAFGGGSRHVFDLATGLKQQGILSRVIASPGQLLEMLGEQQIETVAVPMNGAFDTQAGAKLQAACAAWLADTRSQQRLIHIHGFRAGILARRALGKIAQKEGVPIVYTEHLWTNDYHLPNRLREWLQFRFLRQADQVTAHTIAVSQAVRQFLLDKKITRAEKVTVIPNGVDIEQIANSKRQIEPRDQSSFKLGTVGSLVPIKGHRSIIEALPLIVQNIPDITLEIVGYGPSKSELEKVARRLGVGKLIRWHGHVDQPRTVVAGWDLYLSASTSESFGLAIAEALAEGIPVVATRVGAVAELVTKEVGRLVEPDNAHEIAKAVIDLLPRAELRKTMGAAARERIVARFSLKHMVDKTADLYRELAKRSTMNL